jgi:hypothetical protein
MANGTILPLQATWKGEIMIGGIQAEGRFEVFNSGSGWSFLFGKPLLQAFQAIHDYSMDQVQITGKGGTRMIYNQSQAKSIMVKDLRDREEDEGRTAQERGSTYAKEVQSIDQDRTEKYTDQAPPTEHSIPVNMYTDDNTWSQDLLEAVLDTIPVNFLQDDKAVFTRVADLRNPKRITYIIKSV